MTYELIDKFKHAFKDNKIVLDSYKLNQGYYYLFNDKGTFEKLVVKSNEVENSPLYDHIKALDLYSSIIGCNKIIDTSFIEVLNSKEYNTQKKLFGNNIYTLFFKNKNIGEIFKKENSQDIIPLEIFQKGIDKYYASLYKLGRELKKGESLFKEYIQDLLYEEQEVEDLKVKMKRNFNIVIEDLKEENMTNECWIKIFLDVPLELYKKKSELYMILKSFNNNNMNIQKEDKVYGVNNCNFGLNPKKKYLELKTTPYKVGSLIDTNNMRILRNIYLWLYNNGLHKNFITIPEDFDFKHDLSQIQNIKNKDVYVLRIGNNKGVSRIDDFISVNNYSTNIRKFECGDYINNTSLRYDFGNFSTTDIYKLEWYMNVIWINEKNNEKLNYIKESYYDYERVSKSELPIWKKEFLRRYSTLFFELFHKEKETQFIKKLDKIAIEILENTLIHELQDKSIIKSIECMNLWIALDNYFCEKGVSKKMKINDVKMRVREIIINKQDIKSDDEYYFLVGQVTYYLLSKSESSKLSQDLIEPVIKSNNFSKLKKSLMFLHDKYKHEIYLNDARFNNVFSQLMLTIPDSSIGDNKDLIIAGILSDNMFYTSNKEVEVGGN